MPENPLSLSIEEFWSLLEQSELLSPAGLAKCRQRLANAEPVHAAKWLMEQKRITPLQQEVLLLGHSGPFRFGRYVVMARSGASELSHCFKAVERKTGYPVELHFFDGRGDGALDDWNRIESACDRLASFEHPGAAETFEAIALPEHRFVVTQVAAGKPLAAVSRMGKPMKPATVIGIVAQAATTILEAAEACDLEAWTPSINTVVDAISVDARANVNVRLFGLLAPRQISDSTANSDFPVVDGEAHREEIVSPPLTAPDDGEPISCSLAKLALRLFNGEPLNQPFNSSVKTAADVSGELSQFLSETIANPERDESLDEWLERLVVLPEARRYQKMQSSDSKSGGDGKSSSDADLTNDPVLVKRLEQFRQSLMQSALPQQKFISLEAGLSGINFSENHSSTKHSLTNHVGTTGNRNVGRVQPWMAVAASLLAISVVGGVMAWMAASKKVAVIASKRPKPVANADQASVVDPEVAVAEPASVDADLNSVGYVQRIESDDGKRLWESPTNGQPISFNFIPPDAEILLHILPQEFLGQGEGPRILSALGPDFQQRRTRFEEMVGASLAKLQSLTMAWTTGEESGYELFAKIVVAADREWLINAWGNPSPIELAIGQTVYVKGDLAWAFLDAVTDDADAAGDAAGYTAGDANATVAFVVGSPRKVQQVLQLKGATQFAAPLERLVPTTDRLRHLTLMVRTAALFNQDGRLLMGDWQDQLLTPLRLAIPDAARGMSFGLHLDGDEYLEMRVDHSADMKASQIQKRLQETLSSFATQAGATDSMKAPDYWSALHRRFAAMLDHVVQRSRWQQEFRSPVANAWLNRHAVQNLVAAAELSLSLPPGESTIPNGDEAGDGKPAIPKTLAELLRIPRSLNIANPPDLNVLLSDIVAEVNDDYSQLPFPFRIRMQGNDLQKKGITQNQRPGPLAIEGESLESILTRIMVSANPDKSITGPDDPACELVWVIADDPDNAHPPGTQAILITTRTAAAANGYTLPIAFETKVGKGKD